MTELILKINERTKAGKAFLAMSNTFFTGVEGIEIVKNKPVKKKSEMETTYDPKFVKMLLKAARSKNRTKVTSKNLWQNI